MLRGMLVGVMGVLGSGELEEEGEMERGRVLDELMNVVGEGMKMMFMKLK